MAFFKNLWTFLTETIFLKDERNYRNGLIRWGVRQYKLLFYTARGLDEHDTLVRSAALTFYTLMSIVPIAALVFAVVKRFGLADGLMQNLYSLFPHNREVVDYLITFADKALAAAQGGVVAFVGIVMLFWAVVRVFGSVEEAFNNIWEVKVSRSFTPASGPTTSPWWSLRRFCGSSAARRGAMPVICWGSTPSVRSTRCCRAPSRCWSSGRCSRSSMSWCPIRA